MSGGPWEKPSSISAGLSTVTAPINNYIHC